MEKVSIGVLALFAFVSLTLTHGAKLARDIEEFIEAWRGPARSPRQWWRRGSTASGNAVGVSGPADPAGGISKRAGCP